MSAAIGPGDFVVCINDGHIPHPYPFTVLPHIRRGAVYLVTATGNGAVTRCPLLWLSGVRPSIEGGYRVERFRPYQGPEQASRLTCEPVTERVTA